MQGPSGPSPCTKVNLSPGSLRGFAATMRNSRLKRAEERDEDLKCRLSVLDGDNDDGRLRPIAFLEPCVQDGFLDAFYRGEISGGRRLFEYAHSPPKSPPPESTSPARPSSAKTTTTPTKLTLSKLKGSPGECSVS
jgi:hypothetical protein